MNDAADSLANGIGSIVVSNSPSTVSFYVLCLKGLWEQANLYERTKTELDNTKDELERMKNYADIIAKELLNIPRKE